MDRVEADLGAVAAPAGVQVAADLPGDLRRRVEPARGNASTGAQVVEDQGAVGIVPARIRIGEQPGAIRRVATVAVLRQYVLAEYLPLVGDPIPEDEVAVARGAVVGPGQDMVRIAPVEV